MRLLTAHDASWDAYFLGLGHRPLKVTYEELADAPDASVRGVLEHLDLEVPATPGPKGPRLQVQADDITEDWVQRFQEHLAALERP